MIGLIQNKVILPLYIHIYIYIYIYIYIGLVLSSFFYGYLITQIPGGWMATRFGGKHVFGIGVLVTSLLTLITPQMAYIDLRALIAVRVIIGIFEVVLHTASYIGVGEW